MIRPNEHQTHLVCAHCADIIGVYEPIWMELTGVLAVEHRQRHAARAEHPRDLARRLPRRRHHRPQPRKLTDHRGAAGCAR